MRGKLIVIEGTNNSGKETQTKLLVEKLNKDGIKCEKRRFPDYSSPTGKIISEDILGKHQKSLFDEGINKIPPKVAALYYAADRLYNIDKINELLDQGINVILDRYVESNMAYQASKLETVSERINLILWLEQLEFTLLDLPRPDKVVFLYLPYEYRHDQNESNEHLKSAENVYQLLAERYNFDVIYCVDKDKIKTIDEINEEMYQIVKDYLAN